MNHNLGAQEHFFFYSMRLVLMLYLYLSAGFLHLFEYFYIVGLFFL